MSPDERPLFVYGTLRDPEIRAGVIGRALDASHIVPVRIEGWRAVHYPGALYPGLVAASEGRAEGLLLLHLRPGEIARLDAFEGDEYRRRETRVVGGTGTLAAQAYFPTVAIAPSAPGWTFSTWRENHRSAVIAHYRATGFSGE